MQLCVRFGDAAALGYLEWLWSGQYEACEARIGTGAVVEHQAHWAGEPGGLLAALLELGFIDQTDEDEYAVHDFWDHAPDYVRKRRAREDERHRAGKHLAATDRSLTGHRPDADRTLTDTPAPAPAPAPKKRERSPSAKRTALPRKAFTPPSEAEWLSYAQMTYPTWPAKDVLSAHGYYESRGWSGIVNWKACVRTCFNRSKAGATTTTSLFSETAEAEHERALERGRLLLQGGAR